MTAVAIETSVLESLDFEIVCQTTYMSMLGGGEFGGNSVEREVQGSGGEQLHRDRRDHL